MTAGLRKVWEKQKEEGYLHLHAARVARKKSAEAVREAKTEALKRTKQFRDALGKLETLGRYVRGRVERIQAGGLKAVQLNFMAIFW